MRYVIALMLLCLPQQVEAADFQSVCTDAKVIEEVIETFAEKGARAATTLFDSSDHICWRDYSITVTPMDLASFVRVASIGNVHYGYVVRKTESGDLYIAYAYHTPTGRRGYAGMSVVPEGATLTILFIVCKK